MHICRIINFIKFILSVLFPAEALEALLNRIQVDIEVDSNLNSLTKGDLDIL